MPQIMIVVAAGFAAYAGYRWFQKQVERSDATTQAARADRQREAGAGAPKDLGALEWDEASGAYRPKRPN